MDPITLGLLALGGFLVLKKKAPAVQPTTFAKVPASGPVPLIAGASASPETAPSFVGIDVSSLPQSQPLMCGGKPRPDFVGPNGEQWICNAQGTRSEAWVMGPSAHRPIGIDGASPFVGPRLTPAQIADLNSTAIPVAPIPLSSIAGAGAPITGRFAFGQIYIP